jgi:hypothetical protein
MPMGWIRHFTIFLFLLGSQAEAQFSRMDSLGNWYVIDHNLVWQKSYPLDEKEELDRLLKSNDFTADLDILKFGTSTVTRPYKLVGNNLPEYAQHEYKAFLVIDFFSDRYRVSIKQVTFPDFVEKIYWNGMRQKDSRGSLEHYILRPDGLIRRHNVNIGVLESFDSAFSGVFDPMAGIWSE